MFCEKAFLSISQNSQKNTCLKVSFSIKLQASGSFIKKEAFINFAKYLRTLFYRIPSVVAFEYVSFGLSFVISKVSVADFEHVFVCWGRYRIIIVFLRILEIPYPEKNTQSQQQRPLSKL